jgi:hypothetical protein
MYYKVPRLQEFLSLSELALPAPRNQRVGGQHSLAEPIRTTGEKAWHSVYSVGLGEEPNHTTAQKSGPL